MKKQKKEVLYVAFDVEAAGPHLGVHSTLSVGACAVVRDALNFREYCEKGLVFYAELKPASRAFDEKALRVGSSELVCLEDVPSEGKSFDGAAVLEHMAAVCEEPTAAAIRFRAWLESVSGGRPVIPLVDTVFFDSCRVSLWLHVEGFSLGHSGRDLKSVYQGFAGRANARLKELHVPRNAKPHRADYDAVELAQKARVLLFEKMRW